MASFFGGFLVGATATVTTVQRVGHVRTFAALAAIASVSILAHGMFVSPIIWAMLRFVTGVCYAGVFVVAESWLNDAAVNETRGRLLSIYMLTAFAGMGGGQLLLNLANPADIDLFILVSVLISISIVPMLLSHSARAERRPSDRGADRSTYFIVPTRFQGFAARRRWHVRGGCDQRHRVRNGCRLRTGTRPFRRRRRLFHERDHRRRRIAAVSNREALGCVRPTPCHDGRVLRGGSSGTSGEHGRRRDRVLGAGNVLRRHVIEPSHALDRLHK